MFCSKIDFIHKCDLAYVYFQFQGGGSKFWEWTEVRLTLNKFIFQAFEKYFQAQKSSDRSKPKTKQNLYCHLLSRLSLQF